MRKYSIFFLFVLLCWLCHATSSLILDFSGDLTDEKLQSLKDQLDKYEEGEIFLRLNSLAGEMKPALALARQLSELRASKGVKITAYIDEQSFGPSAIFPFLADRLIATPIFLWGDIIYHANSPWPQGQLESLVLSLISDNTPHSDLLKLIAQAMIDPAVELIDQSGWKLIPISPPSKEPLILGYSELSGMGFDIETMLPEEFQNNFGSAAIEIRPAPIPDIDEYLAKTIHFKEEGSNLVGYFDIPSDRPIDHSIYLQIKFALEEYKRRKVIFVLLHLNTPGGEVFSAMKIAELLQQFDRENHIPVVGVINNWALSAGAMLAYSCRIIGATENALMGAAEPVIARSNLTMKSAPKTITPALRAEFATLAKYYCRNPLIAEAMVDKEMVLVKRHGQIVQLNNDREIRTRGNDPDELITAQGEFLTLDSHQLIDLGIADFMIPLAAMPSVTAEEREMGEWPAFQSQLFNYPFFAKIPYSEFTYYHSWKVDLFSFLTNPLVSSILMIGLVVGIYLETRHLGRRAPGIVALVCLALILLANFAIGTINWVEILLIAIGVCLLLAKIFVLPRFRFLEVIGVLLILLGLFGIFLPNFQSLHFSWNWREWNLPTIELLYRLVFYLVALLVALIIIAVLGCYVTPRFLEKSRVVLKDEQKGNNAGAGAKGLPAVGAEGEAFTSLHPGGKILINFHLYDALTEGTFIEKGEKVVVAQIQGSAIIVAKKDKT
jgi:membrane-bound serine protease (ClpP class)